MKIYHLLESFRQRISWTTMKIILKICELPLGNGWDNTIRKYKDNEIDIPDLKSKAKQLENYYREHLLISNQAINIFPIERKQIDKLISLLKNYEYQKNTRFHKSYPILLSDDDLKEVDTSQKLVEIIDSNKSLILIFSTKRFFIERSEINLQELKEETKKDLINYDKVIGIKQNYRQFFDVIVLSKLKNIIEMRIDITGDISYKQRSAAFYNTKNTFKNLLQSISYKQDIFQKSLNFFPLIDSLYESDEGKVVELGFMTDEGSIKLEKMRKGSDDLRTETYHYAGKQAVDHINSYRLAVEWNYKLSDTLTTKPEL